MVLFGAAVVLVLQVKTLVAYLGIFSFGTLAACLVPVLALGLNWERASRLSVMLSIVTGLVSSVVLELLDQAGVYSSEIPPAFFSLCAALLVFLVVAWFSQKQERSN